MATSQTAVGSLKQGRYVVIDGIACIVRSVQTSRPGKHGHAKCRVEAVGIINKEKKIIAKPAHDNIEIPLIEKKVAQILSTSGDVVNVMDMETYETFDLKVPEELKEQIADGKQVTYWIILNDKIMKQVK